MSQHTSPNWPKFVAALQGIVDLTTLFHDENDRLRRENAELRRACSDAERDVASLRDQHDAARRDASGGEDGA